MRLLIAVTAIVAFTTTSASAQYYGSRGYGSGYGGGSGTGSSSNSHSSSGYTTDRGTYVQPYRATNPNNTQYDNYGTRGNVNPYTGAVGTRSPRY